jgi:hypothetical protein
MACGGLKSAEKKIEARLLNRHHSVRVTDFAMEIANFVKTMYLKNGKQLEVNIGIHSGPVISGVVGETKPQFSLIGDSVNKTSRVCSLTQPHKVSVSKETHRHLELYTNNYSFTKTFVEMKGIGLEPIFQVGNMKGRTRNQQEKFKAFDGKLTANDHPKLQLPTLDQDNAKDQKQQEDIVKRDNLGLINDSDSIESNIDYQGYETHRGLIENATYD